MSKRKRGSAPTDPDDFECKSVILLAACRSARTWKQKEAGRYALLPMVRDCPIQVCGGIALITHSHHTQAWPRRTVNQLVKLLAGRGAGVRVGESNSRMARK